MILGIDASNIRLGGGVTHLKELLASAEPKVHGIERVIVWGGRNTLGKLLNCEWLEKAYEKKLDGGLFARLYWQRITLPKRANRMCDLLFIPGGNFHGNFKPYVAMSQNLLPFSPQEGRLYGMSWRRIRNEMLYWGQSATFRHANGMIFLTPYAHKCVESSIGKLSCPTVIIPHGIGDFFRCEPRKQLPLGAF